MGELIQLDFFEATEFSVLKARIEEVSDSAHRVRKGIHAKHGALQKRILELESRMEILERNICKGES